MSDKNPQNPKKTRKAAGGNTPQGGPAQKKPRAEVPDREEETAFAAAVDPHSVGKTLRRARMEMKLSLEDISAAINVRVVQLQAIEDDRIDQLPGMTYAVGFVRSYADFVKLDPLQVVKDFKKEHAGEDAAKRQLKIPEPIDEDKLPSPIVIGVAALAVVIVFILWSIFSDDSEIEVQTASNIPPPPVVGTASGMPTLADQQPLTSTTAEAANIAAGLPAGAADAASPSTGMIAIAPPTANANNGAVSGTVGTPAETASVVVPPVVATAPPVAPKDPVINVRRGTTRVLLQAREKSWVQIADGNGKVIYKKVMDKGEEFYVPDQKGMTLVTSNAGGLNFFVDGNKVQPIGKEGEVMRGVNLSPDELKKKRIRMGR
jgi:cytoskeleton protein RodZ